jgi:hypothetical protein
MPKSLAIRLNRLRNRHYQIKLTRQPEKLAAVGWNAWQEAGSQPPRQCRSRWPFA